MLTATAVVPNHTLLVSKISRTLSKRDLVRLGSVSKEFQRGATSVLVARRAFLVLPDNLLLSKIGHEWSMHDLVKLGRVSKEFRQRTNGVLVARRPLVLPDNLLVVKVIQGHLLLHQGIQIGRVNKELHARTINVVKGLSSDRIKRFWGRCVHCLSNELLVKRFKETCRLSRASGPGHGVSFLF